MRPSRWSLLAAPCLSSAATALLAILLSLALLSLLSGSDTSLAAAPAGAPSPSEPPAPHAPAQPALRVLSERVLPPELADATDVRWASDRTVYLPLVRAGTVEAAVDASGPPTRTMVAGGRAAGGWDLNCHLGASSSYLVVAGPFFGLTWRTLDSPLRKEALFSDIEDVDVAGNRLLVLGTRADKHRKLAPDGTIAWIGSLDKDLSDLRPVLADAGGPGAPNFFSCGLFEMGAVRFLAGGSYIVVPGVQPGASLFDSGGRLLRTWDTVGLGLDSDCASLTKEEASHMATDFDARVAWLNHRRTLDEALPLPEGPGLVIRTVVDDRPRWQLKVLESSGRVAVYGIPVQPVNARSHLHGDVRGSRIVFLMETQQQGMVSHAHPAGRLIVAELPRS